METGDDYGSPMEREKAQEAFSGQAGRARHT